MPESRGFVDLGFAKIDTDRLARTGDPEVVLASHKTPAHTVQALATLAEAHPERAVLATRCDEPTRRLCAAEFAAAVVDDIGRTVRLGRLPEPRGRVVVVTAGSSDEPVAREAAVTVEVFGAAVDLVVDVGVAGLHRLVAELDRITTGDAVIAVAGVDGALPGVLAGLIGQPLIAVPTSVGYGASFGGIAALLTMLNACAPGVSVVNIDNGFGAGVAAARIARQTAPRP